MSDNGYFLGERGFAGKWTMPDLSIRVPLIIYDPRMASVRRGIIDSNLVLNVDIAPAILTVSGILKNQFSYQLKLGCLFD